MNKRQSTSLQLLSFYADEIILIGSSRSMNGVREVTTLAQRYYSGLGEVGRGSSITSTQG